MALGLPYKKGYGVADMTKDMIEKISGAINFKNMLDLGMGQKHVLLLNIKIAGKWIFIPQDKV